MLSKFSGYSLRHVLLRRLLWPLIPILLLGILLSYGLAQHAAVNAYDSGLLDDARDLAHQIELRDNKYVMELPHAAAEMLAINNEDRVIYAIWSANGEHIAGEKSLSTAVGLPKDREYALQDLTISDKLYRTVVLRRSYNDANIFVAVAQTVKGRTYLLREIFYSMLLLGGVLVIASIAVVVSAVRTGLMPVEALRNEIASRSTNDLQPLSEQSAPIELRPIIHGINELLEKLAASFAGYRRFIADAAHQLRTPLAALGTQLEVNLAQPPDDVPVLLEQLLATTQRTSHLANQLLSLARLEHTNGSVIEAECVDLREVMQHVAPDFISRAARKSVEFEFSIEPSSVRGSSLLLRELLSNLFDNAVRYAPPQSTINVLVRYRENSVELVIADTGPGVLEEELKKLGTPFYQLPTNSPEGCGLGLAIVREIAHIHRGAVTFQRNNPGSGLLVIVRFPAEMQHQFHTHLQ